MKLRNIIFFENYKIIPLNFCLLFCHIFSRIFYHLRVITRNWKWYGTSARYRSYNSREYLSNCNLLDCVYILDVTLNLRQRTVKTIRLRKQSIIRGMDGRLINVCVWSANYNGSTHKKRGCCRSEVYIRTIRLAQHVCNVRYGIHYEIVGCRLRFATKISIFMDLTGSPLKYIRHYICEDYRPTEAAALWSHNPAFLRVDNGIAFNAAWMILSESRNGKLSHFGKSASNNLPSVKKALDVWEDTAPYWSGFKWDELRISEYSF